MPSSMTHTYFGSDVLAKLPKNCQNKIQSSMGMYQLFCQGSDPFMFYHFFIGYRAKKVASIQSMMHHTKTRDFFIHTIQSIHKHHFIHNDQVMAFLYGYICHYFLDLYVHPFIYYKAGKFKKKDKSSYRYNALHQEYEYNIDLYLIQLRENIKPYHYKVYKNIFQIEKFSNPLKIIIHDSIEKTYQVKNISKLYFKSAYYMKLFFRFFNYDPYGIKYRIYHFLDIIKPKSWIRLDELSYYHPYSDDLSFLNLEHHVWCHPSDRSLTYTTSFLDLYQSALEDAVRTIIKVTDMLENDTYDENILNDLFGNLSFSTGMPCDKDIEMKYFEL